MSWTLKARHGCPYSQLPHSRGKAAAYLSLLLALALTLAGCKKYKDVIYISIDPNHLSPYNRHFVSIAFRGGEQGYEYSQEFKDLIELKDITKKSIHGKEYYGMVIFRDYTGDIPPKEDISLEIFCRRQEKPEPLIDIYLSTKVRCSFEVEGAGAATIQDTETNLVLSAPFLFEPGEYHFVYKYEH